MSRLLGAILAAIGLISLCLLLSNQGFATLPAVPLWIVDRVPERMPCLKPGMTEPQVLAALGLTGYKVGPAMGSGPFEAYGSVYPVEPGMNLYLVFDCTKKPSRFEWGEVVNTDQAGWRVWAAVEIGLILFGGWLFLRRPSLSTSIGGRKR